jgi:DNA ligase-associated metallophosphoesterase
MANKCLYWKEQSTLVVSDVHLGKASHFQKAGLPIPSLIGHEDLNAIAKVIFDIRPKTVIFLGDLFHSNYNEEWNWFKTWMDHFPETQFKLVIGNHDQAILPMLPENLDAIEEWFEPPFLFTHEPVEEMKKDLFYVSGHLHPGVVIKGKGRQYAKLPCFWKKKNQLIMPAFGNLTGAMKMPTKGAEIYAIFENEIVRI